MAAFLRKHLREREVLDGNEYRNCKFIDCQLAYQGGDIPVIMGCELLGSSQFTFEGSAARTVAFLQGMHAGGFAPVVESTISMIRGEAAPQMPGNAPTA